jgi:hypothetical protein
MPVVDGPKTLGTHFYGLPADPAMFEWDTMYAPTVHHNAVVPGEYAHVIFQAGRWLGVRTYLVGLEEKILIERLICREAREELVVSS